jgi:hypothetical protein
VAFGGNNTYGPASEYLQTNPNSCSDTDKIGAQINCLFSELVSTGQMNGTDEVLAYAEDDAKTETFYPTTNGFAAASGEVQERLGFISAEVEGRGCPSNSGLDLRIVGIGDSITFGVGSDNGNGYFETLDKALSVGLDGCSRNTYEFIGSQMGGIYRNESHSGKLISEIHTNVIANGT